MRFGGWTGLAVAISWVLLAGGASCASKDSAADSSDSASDASTDAKGDASCVALYPDTCPCNPLPDFCAGALPGAPCPATLDEAEDASTWGVTNCTISKSTNTCEGDVEVEVERGGGVDVGFLFFYDSTTGHLVGAKRVLNLGVVCWGVVPTTCSFDEQLMFDTYDAGVCASANAAADASPDASDD